MMFRVKAVTTTNPGKPKLVVFDVEGVLIPKNRLFFEVARELGMIPLLKVLFYGFLYEIGIMPLKKALTKVFKVFEGVKVDLLVQKLVKLPLTPDAEAAFFALKRSGCKTALISSGFLLFWLRK
jgi:phosphoserine phosphatase